MYLTQPESAKNILQNEMPSDFVFYLENDKKSTENDIDWLESRMITAAIFQKKSQPRCGVLPCLSSEIGNEVDNSAS